LPQCTALVVLLTRLSADSMRLAKLLLSQCTTSLPSGPTTPISSHNGSYFGDWRATEATPGGTGGIVPEACARTAGQNRSAEMYELREWLAAPTSGLEAEARGPHSSLRRPTEPSRAARALLRAVEVEGRGDQTSRVEGTWCVLGPLVRCPKRRSPGPMLTRPGGNGCFLGADLA